MQKLLLALILCLLSVGGGLQAASQPDMVAKVVSGELREAKASWWGFDPEDSTQFLQAAIRSKVPRLIVDQQASSWITGPLFLESDQEIVFEEDVELLAKAGLFRGNGDSLLTASNKKNVKLIGIGKGAVLRMRKSDYHAEPYTKAEWRHGLALRSVENVTVENLSIVSSGGDGIYLGVATRGVPCRNVTIKNVVCDDNNRQGISIISADKLLMEDCTFKNTWGTAPAAGIDFEPNGPDEQLTDCIIRRCIIENNDGNGIHFYMGEIKNSLKPISVRIEDCTVRGNKGIGLTYIPDDSMDGSLQGSCELINCRFENCEAGGIMIGEKHVDSSTLTFRETSILNCGKDEKNTSPIEVRTGEKYLEYEFVDFGGIDFGVVRVTDTFDRRPLVIKPFVQCDLYRHPLNVRGTLQLRRGDKTETVEINNAWFAREYPDVIPWIPPEKPESERFVPLEKANVDVDTKFPPVWQRYQGSYWIYAEKGTPIRFALAVRQLGGNELGTNTGVLTLPGGETRKFEVPADKAGNFDYVLENAPETGVYRLSVNVRGHAIQMLRCNQTVVLPVVPRMALISTTGTFYLHVPSGTKEFGIRVRGDQPNEAIKASVVDPSGKTVWMADNIVSAVQFDRTAQDGKIEGVWQIVLDRPSRMAFEDNKFSILGVPPLLGLNPKQLLIPRP